MHDTPRKPVGATPKIAFDRRTHDELYNKLRFVNSSSVKFDRTVRGVVGRARRPRRYPAPATRPFPFKIYVFPSGKRASPDLANDWRKFRVRNGRVVGNTITPVEPSGTDGAANPDDFTVDESDMTDITVDAGVAKYWFWLEIDEGSATASIEHSETPPAAWTLTVIPIGWVDTDTYETEKRANIQQLLRTDVIIPCLEFPEE